MKIATFYSNLYDFLTDVTDEFWENVTNYKIKVHETKTMD